MMLTSDFSCRLFDAFWNIVNVIVQILDNYHSLCSDVWLGAGSVLTVKYPFHFTTLSVHRAAQIKKCRVARRFGRRDTHSCRFNYFGHFICCRNFYSTLDTYHVNVALPKCAPDGTLLQLPLLLSLLTYFPVPSSYCFYAQWPSTSNPRSILL